MAPRLPGHQTPRVETVGGKARVGKLPSPSTYLVSGRNLPPEVEEDRAGPGGAGSARERWRDGRGAGLIVTGSL